MPCEKIFDKVWAKWGKHPLNQLNMFLIISNIEAHWGGQVEHLRTPQNAGTAFNLTCGMKLPEHFGDISKPRSDVGDRKVWVCSCFASFRVVGWLCTGQQTLNQEKKTPQLQQGSLKHIWNILPFHPQNKVGNHHLQVAMFRCLM